MISEKFDISSVGGDIIIKNVAPQFSLDDTLDCGQAFRWKKQSDGSYFGIVAGKELTVSISGSDAVLHGVTYGDFENIWRRYFDFETDYDAIKESYSSDPILSDAMQYAPGIRILRQEPFETVCSFIISTNNNIPRIKGIIERLCALLGERTPHGYAFPTPEAFKNISEEDLAPLRAGYRSKFLLDAAQKALGEVDLDALSFTDTPTARKELMKIKGVGPKVADCVLLFAYGRYECFPLDTWMKKVTAHCYPDGLPAEILDTAGIAQQYLFHYARHHAEMFG